MCAPHVDSTDAMDERSGSLFSLLCHQPGGCAGATGEGGGQGSPLSFCWSGGGWPQFSLWFLATGESYFLNVSILPFPRPLTRESRLFFFFFLSVLLVSLGCSLLWHTVWAARSKKKSRDLTTVLFFRFQGSCLVYLTLSTFPSCYVCLIYNIQGV